jgi:hypothetical protein
MSSFVPKEAYKEFAKGLIRRLDSHLAKPGYYESCYVPHTAVFDSLQRAHVSIEQIKQHASHPAERANRPVLATFLPALDGLCRPAVYDRLSGRTGRLKVTAGPSILTLKREHRDILTSRFPGGRIASIDYSSLEARTFLYSVGEKMDEDDIYAMIARKLFKDEYPRSVIKAVVISLLYGMGDVALSVKLGLDKAKVRKLSREVRKFFRYDELKEKLESQLAGDRILNHYGRSIEVPDVRLLINTFVQSSAVDVTLHGFARMVAAMPPDKCVPIFTLHDALIVDVAPGCPASFVREGMIVPGYEGRFPLHISRF